jgi:hypothetical protein
MSENDTNTLAEIIDEIETKTLLHHPDFEKPFDLFTDASNVGIGAVLTQNKKIIGYYSKKLTKSENNYSIVEKECFAAIKGLLHFKTIIYNAHITIHTDSMDIIFAKELGNNRYQRWKIILEEYDYEIKHTKGDENKCADFLSINFIIAPMIKKSNQITQ